MIELAIIEPTETDSEAFDESVMEYHYEMIKRVCDGILERMRKMANAIELEKEGLRKQKMLELYEKTDEELMTWQKLKNPYDTLCKLDRSHGPNK